MKRYEKFFEMAYSRNEIINKIMDFDTLINEHIVKLLLFPEEKQNHRQWINHSGKHIFNISLKKWQKNNRYLPKETYYEYFFIRPFENNDDYEYLDNLVYNELEEYSDLISPYSINGYPKMKWIKLIKEFYNEVSELISVGKLTKINLNKLYHKYFI
jgi:hypothetical protein